MNTTITVPTREVTFTIKVELPIKRYEQEVHNLLNTLADELVNATSDEQREEVYEAFFGDFTMPAAEALEVLLEQDDTDALDAAVRALEDTFGEGSIQSIMEDYHQEYLPLDQYLHDDVKALHPFPEGF